PKPMVEIGGKPILWHIMKIYSFYGLHDFIICCGYKGDVIKEYFANYFLNMSDVTFDLKNNKMEVHNCEIEPWRVTLVDTGLKTMTGGRLKRISKFVADEPFCMAYGDCVSNVDINSLIKFHKGEKNLATLTAVQPQGRFGALMLSGTDNKIRNFTEKPKGDGAWINGGFFVLDPEVISYIDDELTVWEHKPLQDLAKDGRLSAYRHFGFWQSLDTLRDKNVLEEIWRSGDAPWKVWKET
ncbi:MAG: glucose-1-phosphate cytidylyltransferase, partial [Thermodesulfobacteriota bacterium]